MSDRTRLALLTLSGILCAVLAAFSSVGLLTVSGWFIAACAVAGITAGSTFSYLSPSGAVRAFAVGRIAADYVSRVLQHKGALLEQGESRARLLERMSHARMASGAFLDRAVSDVDERSMRHIRVTAPILSAVVLSAAAVAMSWTVSSLAAGIVLGASVVSAVVGALSGFGAAELDVDRAAARRLVAAVAESRDDMASVGATRMVSREVERAIARLGVRERRDAADLTTPVIACIWAMALAAAGVAASAAVEADSSSLCLVLLMLAGLSGNWTAVAPAVRHERRLVRARRRLEAPADADVGAAGDAEIVEGVVGAGGIGSVGSVRAAGNADPALSIPVDALLTSADSPGHLAGALALTVGVPSAASRQARQERILLNRGSVLFVTGRSGAGKTTMLRALERGIRDRTDFVVRRVTVDDHVFAGTVADNLRIADPTLEDSAMEDLLRRLELSGITPSTLVGVGGRPLSGGEETRLRIARGILSHPGVLLVDEPTAGLDPRRAGIVMDLLRGAAPFVVIALHDPDAAGLSRAGDGELAL